VVAEQSLIDEHTRVLKDGDTFAIFDHHGDIKQGGLGEEGLYHGSTRHLSRLTLELAGDRPCLLSSTVREENDELAVTLTNPDLLCDGVVQVALGTLHVDLRRFLWQGSCYQRLRLKNHGQARLHVDLAMHFAADFMDIYEVRGMKRKARGKLLPAELSRDRVMLAYRGLDGITRRTSLRFDPAPAQLSASSATIALSLAPREEASFTLTMTCERQDVMTPVPRRLDDARDEAKIDLERYKTWSCHLHSSNAQVNAWIGRAVSDLHMLTTLLPTGPYPYAGVPWFNTPFGRDGLITAFECLWLRPSLARGVLSYLASTQATDTIAEQDAEPGKILHETRSGEMATLKEMPFGRYYGSVDATPLFVYLAGAYFDRTADRDFVQSIWPNACAALEWIDRQCDRDPDGFLRYRQHTPQGLIHHGWKDSDDAVFHADGAPARGAVAMCEVQGYVYAARQAGAALAAALGLTDRAATLLRQADAVRERFDARFFSGELGTYVFALDGDDRPCQVRTSNAGQCLFTRIAAPERAWGVARGLLTPESYSGWGIRTVGTAESRYNPMAYHNGAVWPHDNALIALGFARYGMTDLAVQLWEGLFEAGLAFDMHRMPELFCGFPRSLGEGPTLYPVACSPQAWSAASVFLLFQACLGLEINGTDKRVCFTRPQLPAALEEFRIHNLQVADATVDLQLIRYQHDVSVNVLRREGDVQVMVVK
jgi:glycogen debranching enzyme